MQYSYILSRLVSKLLNIMNRKNQHAVFYLLYFSVRNAACILIFCVYLSRTPLRCS